MLGGGVAIRLVGSGKSSGSVCQFSPTAAFYHTYSCCLFSSYTDKTSTEVRLKVIREYGKDNDVTVYYKARDLTERFTTKPGLQTSQAFAGEDYEKPTAVSVRFAKGEVSVWFICLSVIIILVKSCQEETN